MSHKKENILLVHRADNYNFWVGIDENGNKFYNVTPQDQPKPNGGYYSSNYICCIKGVANYFI